MHVQDLSIHTLLKDPFMEATDLLTILVLSRFHDAINLPNSPNTTVVSPQYIIVSHFPSYSATVHGQRVQFWFHQTTKQFQFYFKITLGKVPFLLFLHHFQDVCLLQNSSKQLGFTNVHKPNNPKNHYDL